MLRQLSQGLVKANRAVQDRLDPQDKILDQTELKAFADDKLKVKKNDNFCL